MTTRGGPRAGSGRGSGDGETRETVPPPPGSIADAYREVLPTLDFAAEQTKWDVAISVAPRDLHDVIETSRRDERLAMDFLRNLTAVDWQEAGLEVVYHLFSTRHRHSVCVKTRLTAARPSLPTLTDVYRGAEWAEREAREMFGIEFEGHPDPRNLLLDEDLDIHPLLKSHPLAPIELEQGVDVEYFTKQHPPAKPAGDDRAARMAEAKKRAAAEGEKRPAAELSPEERAAKKAEQAERVKRARELAAARRAGGPAAAMKAKTAAAAPAPAAPPAAAEPATGEVPARPQPVAPGTGGASATPKKATADMTPQELAERKQAQAERVKRARELAAARRAERRGEG